MRGPMSGIFKHRRMNSGYTLIQLSISILILGLMIGPAAMVYGNYKKTMDRETTFKNVVGAIDSIQLRRSGSGDYPCPAPMTASRDDPAYGGALADCPGVGSTSIPIGSCSNGICVEEGRGGARVLVGAVPFRDLQMDELRSYDAYGSRLVYAVTESMTDDSTFDPSLGAVFIEGENGQSVVEPAGSASFIIFSPGPNHVGGYTLDGVARVACGGLGRDVMNCNPGFSGGTPKPEARYIAAYENSRPGADYFDDQVNYFSQVDTPYWRQTTADQNNIQDLSPNNVGVGVIDPTAELTIVSASGEDSLRVNDALIVDQLCNTNGECFAPEMFTTNPQIQCDPDEYLAGIKNGVKDCIPDSTAIPVHCGPGEVLIGLNTTTGEPICDNAPPKSCAPTSATVCSTNDVSAGVTKHNGTVSFTRGDCRTASYKCNNGVWQSNGASGQCNFTPPVPDTYSTCGIQCPKWYTGTYCNNYRVVCTGTQSLGNTRAQDCTCVGGSEPQSQNCSHSSIKGSGWKGTAWRTLTVSPPNCTSSYSAWDMSACSCSANTANGTLREVANGSCPSGFKGEKKRQQAWSTATCSWVNTGVTTDTCTCNTDPLPSQQVHVCDDPICEMPDKPDIFETPIDPATCKKGTKQLVSTGSCINRSFKWVMVTATGQSQKTSTSIGSSCSCSDRKSGKQEFCGYPGDPNNLMYECTCQ